ncbi:hypothetical protein ACLRAA_03225 [Gallibacterium anatis]|uniref:Beta-methylgalactoside transporter inner membrane component n=2 Tax=Gallibacterium anatis TaxID=750 RepID=U1I6R2_9PAST|nr:hypothetical protein [Gallibacterium anatis]ERF79075.1 hypothetical protein N561_02775 [Gallibacterium anatis 12656/12]KGQ41345.1 hypothetical protein JP30_04920 [Gallibacterium anatis IPDH697-78]KGQ46680.1 hypothetical protein JP29_02445 [Gallibacterium anatis]KGQ48252.1 hypothetical protein JL04_08320 [Gallibacterium anatis]WIM83562.1 hypothetical protein QP020_07180 [Gallibacterium anatis]
MPINFFRIFQESGYFVRNRYPIVITFTVLFALNSLVFQLIVNSYGGLEKLLSTPTLIPSPLVFAAFINLFLTLLFTVWFILTVDQILTNRIGDMFLYLGESLKKVFGFAGYNIILLLAFFPMFMGLSALTISSDVATLMISAVASFAISGYLLTRVALLPFAYLLEPNKQSLGKLYQLINQRRQWKAILGYLFFVYVLPMLVSNQLILLLGANLVVVSTILTAFINLFSLIFAYRFYRVFMKKVSL